MDEDLAEALADEDLSTRGDPELPISEATHDVLLLTQIVSLLRTMVQQREKKRIPFPPLAFPKTARHKIAERRRNARRARLLATVAEAQARYAALHPEETPPTQ
ncbi:MAG: hypothetical protein HOV78_11635 [Hamadaea sp.]|nr:hypothetical protein [Hamadaea sp.]